MQVLKGRSKSASIVGRMVPVTPAVGMEMIRLVLKEANELKPVANCSVLLPAKVMATAALPGAWPRPSIPLMLSVPALRVTPPVNSPPLPVFERNSVPLPILVRPAVFVLLSTPAKVTFWPLVSMEIAWLPLLTILME